MNLKKYMGVILIAVIVFFVVQFYNVKENFTATSCTQFTNCAQCVNGKVHDTNSPCYWNDQKKQCGSFNDPGYSRVCHSTPDPPTPDPPTPEPPTPDPNPGPCPICKQCPELTLLKHPTFITKQ
jgi:hypothetical protein